MNTQKLNIVHSSKSPVSVRGSRPGKLAATSAGAGMSVDTYLTKMAQEPRTYQWDVVCSYSLERINQLLAQKHAANMLPKELTLRVDRQDALTGEDVTINFDIVLGPPCLKFIAGTAGQAELTIPLVSGTYSITPKSTSVEGPKKAMPENKYSIILVVPIVCVHGETRASIAAGDTIRFAPARIDEWTVTVTFDTSLTTGWTFDPPLDLTSSDLLQSYFLPALQTYFKTKVDHVAYGFAGLNNKQPEAGATVLDPKFFTFMTVGGDNSGNSGFLNLFIATGSSNYDPNVPFGPFDLPLLPVPDGYSASLVLSRDLVQRVYLLPQLANAGMTGMRNLVDPVAPDQAGSQVCASIARNMEIPGDFVNFMNEHLNLEPATLDFLDNPFRFAFTTRALRTTMQLSTSIDWYVWTIAPRVGMVKTKQGTATATIHMDKTVDLRAIGMLTDDTVRLSFDISPQDFAIDISPGVDDSCWNDDMGSRVADAVRAELGPSLPNVSLHFAGLDFFRTTNLLFPGDKVIHFDAAQGITMPCDMALLGNIVL